jgi:hypothetical protein
VSLRSDERKMTEAMRMKHWPYMIVPDVAEIAEKKKKKKNNKA